MIGLGEGSAHDGTRRYEIVVGGWSNGGCVIRYKNLGAIEAKVYGTFLDVGTEKEFEVDWSGDYLMFSTIDEDGVPTL